MSAGAIPTNDGQACVFASMPSDRFATEIRHDVRRGYGRVLEESAPELTEQLKSAERHGKLYSFPGIPGHLRDCHGPGWALVGDAGYFKDPLTAHGITDALRDAELLARAVTRGGEAALSEYQSLRDELSLELFDITDAVASFGWDLESLKQLHLDLSKQMNHEVDVLKELETPSSAGWPRSA